MTTPSRIANATSAQDCRRRFDDLTGTIFGGHHQPLHVWIVCLYVMGLMIRMLANVKQATIGPLIKRTIAEGTVVYTDEYDIYSRLEEWGSDHRTVCHAKGEYARDDDGDGFCETHVNTLEGFWSLLRSWLRPHRGISQEKLPLYLGFFEFIH